MTAQQQLFTCAGGVPVAYPLFQAGGGGSIPTSALQLRFQPITTDLAVRLNARWHSALPYLSRRQVNGLGGYGMCYGAVYGGSCYASAIWSTPPALNRMNVSLEEIIELRRLAICPQAPKNTASRMLGWMVRDLRKRHPAISRFISYQSLEHHDGTIYRAAGWRPGPQTPFKPWTHNGGCPTQIGSDKVRWERQFHA